METEQITLRLYGTKLSDTEINQSVQVGSGENYYQALSQSLKKAQDDFNALLTDVIQKDSKRSEGNKVLKLIDEFDDFSDDS